MESSLSPVHAALPVNVLANNDALGHDLFCLIRLAVTVMVALLAIQVSSPFHVIRAMGKQSIDGLFYL